MLRPVERATGYARLGSGRIAYEVAVHLAIRITALAGRGEILVSRTVKDLVVGSDLGFDDRGTHHLKGIEGERQILSVRRAA